jgi:hypothetical protein
MEINDLLENALKSEDPFNQLRSLLRELLNNGYEREKLKLELDIFRKFLLSKEREEDFELINDMLSFLEGWCGPHMVL